MKMIGKIAIAAIALLVTLALVPALIPDEEYSPSAREWLDIAHTPSTIPPLQNRFHAQVGFLATPNADMVKYGASLVADANRVLAAKRTDFDPAWQDSPIKPSAALSDIDFDAIIGDPLTWLADNRPLLHRLVEENAVLLERYRTLAQMRDYSFTLIPDYRSPIPNYSGLASIHRLNSLAIVNAIINEGDNPSRLRASIASLRNALSQSAMILEKMINVTLLRFDLTLYAELMAHPGIAGMHVPFIGLNAAERTLRPAYITEFASASTLLDGDLSGETSNWFEASLLSLYLKPRKLENHTHQNTWMHLLSLESRPLAERRHLVVGTTYSWWERYTDPIGYILYEIARPTYTYHNARVCTVDDSDCWIGVVRDEYNRITVSDEYDTATEARGWLSREALKRGERCEPVETTTR